MRTRVRIEPSALVRAAWMTVWPSLSAWRSQTPSGEKESSDDPALRKSSSTTRPRLIEAATKGLTTATKAMPISIAAATGTAMSSSAETPEARMTTSSLVRAKRRNVIRLDSMSTSGKTW